VVKRKTAAACIGGAVVLLAAPGLAQARTKVVTMGPPVSALPALQKAGADINDFFPHGVTIHVGDKVKFAPTGFHTADFPAKGAGAAALIAPTGAKADNKDAAGAPFWFDGQDVFGFNPALFASKFGKSVSYNGSKSVNSGLPLAAKPKPMTVKFTKAGTYTYYCDVHAGMKGTVKVLKAKAKIPSKKADASALKRQVARDTKTLKSIAKSTVPANTVDVGVAGPHGEEIYAFMPSALKVSTGTTIKFRMSPSSFEDHTATTGPGDPNSDPSSYLGQIAASFAGPGPLDSRGVYPSDPPGTAASLSPVLHGNGFWNSGVMDTSSATPLASENSVTFSTPGTYQFYCMIHPFMHGTVTVQ
jgi:plastocyanin